MNPWQTSSALGVIPAEIGICDIAQLARFVIIAGKKNL